MLRPVLSILLLCCSLAAQEIVTVRPKPIGDVLTNPSIGFMTFQRFNGDALNEGTKWTEGYPIAYQPFHGNLLVPNQPLTSIAYFRIYWKFLEPEMGKYRWELIDTALRTAHDRGQTLDLRVAPYGTNPDNDVPDWYRKLLGDESAKKMMAKWRTDPENPLYVRHFTRFVRELAKRYDGHPDLDLVDVSFVGAWGEGEGTGQLSDATMRALVDSYLDNFHKTPLVMQPTDRRTNTYALSKKAVGWRADCLGDMRCTEGRNWCHMFDAYPEDIVKYGIEDAWKKAPVTLEACWVMQHWKNQGWDVDYILEQALKWHVSSFNNKSSQVPPEWRPQVDRWLQRMGYRFALRKFTYPRAVAAEGKLAFTSWWENQGVAPIYHEYPLALRLKGAARTEVLLTDADTRAWLPGDAVYDNAVFVPAGMPAGDYELAIGMLDPETRKPAIKLAIEGRDAEGWYPVGRIQVR
jgi:hypothetical protein